MTTNENKERVIAYVDGFNLYFGLKERYAQAKWLNVYALADSLMKENQVLVAVKYFTSTVSNDPEKEHRQRTYLSAIGTTSTEIIYGHYKSKPKSCFRCGHSWRDNEEKMTDVNIAVHMLIDAMEDRYDAGLLISGDSDLVPPIKAIHENFPTKRIIVGFPPKRHNNSVKNVAKGSFTIGRKKLMDAQFENSIELENGYQIQKPEPWN